MTRLEAFPCFPHVAAKSINGLKALFVECKPAVKLVYYTFTYQALPIVMV